MKLYWGCGMKNYAKWCLVGVLTVCLLLPIVYCNRLLHTMTAIRYVTFSFDPQLSPMICQAIKQKVMFCEHNGIYNSSAIIDTISSFPVIKSMKLEQFPAHIARITLDAYDPIMCINDDRIVLENNFLLSADYYTVSKTSSLQKIRCAGPLPVQVSAPIMEAMKQCLSQKIFDYYTVYFVNEHEWYFSDIKDPSFTMCCTTSSLPINMIQIAYAKLKKQIQKESISHKWIADMRFGDQIILSMDKGGRYG